MEGLASTRGRLSRKVLRRNADLWLAAGLIAAGIYFLGGRFTTVRFERERIEVRVGHGLVRVTGLYQYRNASLLPAVLTLSVPFPVDRAHPWPAVVLLSDAGQDIHEPAGIPFTIRGGQAWFRLFFRSGEVRWIRLDYVQPAGVANGRYLLTTTRAWRRPIGSASFTLLLPRCFALAASNYALAPTPVPGPWKAYSFSRTDFYPGSDWEFSWEEGPSCAAAHGAAHRGGSP